MKKRKSTVLMSLLLAVVLLLSCATPAFGAVTYPPGTDSAKAEISSDSTDTLVREAAALLGNGKLEDMVLPMLWSDGTLSSILTGIYGELDSASSALSILGIYIKPSDLAVKLYNYRSVATKLENKDSWEGIDLSGAEWGITDENGFAQALAAVFSPFNNVLSMLLAGRLYRKGIIIIPGDYGYSKGLISMLEALGCTEITDGQTFLLQEKQDQNSMMKNIVLSLLSMLKRLLAAPADTLTDVLPELADYIKNGGLEQSVNAIFRPLTLHIGDYIQFFTASQLVSFAMFVSDPSKYTLRFSENITYVLNDLIESSEFSLPPIDLDALIEAKGIKGDAYTLIALYIIDALKMNKDRVLEVLDDPSSLGLDIDLGDMDIDLKGIVSSILEKSNQDLYVALINLFTKKTGTPYEYQWTAKEYTRQYVEYDEGMTEEDYLNILNGVDETLGEFLQEFSGDYSSIKEAVKMNLYTNGVITKLVTTVYGLLGSEELGKYLGILGIKTSTAGLASYLTENSFYYARQALWNENDWSEIEEINWGFKDGSRKGFQKALTAVLRPFENLLEALLANGAVKVLDSVYIGGSTGWNTAIIPILEALGCPEKSIKTLEQYEKAKGSDKILTYIIDPILDLLDQVAKKPVYTLTEILPNALFFIDNGSLMQCVSNLLEPINQLLGRFGLSFEKLGIDLSDLTELDVLSFASSAIPGLVEGMGIKMEAPDLKKLEFLGESTMKGSKRTYNGEKTDFQYIEADQTALMKILFEYAINLIASEENSDLLGSFMGGAGASGGGSEGSTPTDVQGASMFDEYSAQITEQFKDMTPQEIERFIYELLFEETAEVEITEEYIPDITYVPEKKKAEFHPTYLVIPLTVITLAVIVTVFNRDRIKDALSKMKRKRKK